MAEFHLHISVLVVLFLLLFIGLGEAWLDPFRAVAHKVGVDHSCFQGLVGPVEHLQHIAADELVVSVDSDHDRLKRAVVHGVNVDVVKGGLPPLVFKQNVLPFVDAVEGKVFAVKLQAAIIGVVVHDHHEVIAVILGEN